MSEPIVEMGSLFFARKDYRRSIEYYDFLCLEAREEIVDQCMLALFIECFADKFLRSSD